MMVANPERNARQGKRIQGDQEEFAQQEIGHEKESPAGMPEGIHAVPHPILIGTFVGCE